MLGRNPRALLRGAYRRSYRILTDIPGDIALGVSTGLWKEKFGDESRQFYGYEPVPYSTLRDIEGHLRRHGIRVQEFVDIGCGHGRPLYYFSGRFPRLTGYEVNPHILVSSAGQLQRVRARRPEYRNIRIVGEDGIDALPNAGDIVVFLYNPFGPIPLARLCETLARRHGRTHVYYVNPQHAEIIETSLGIVGEEFSSFMKVRYYSLDSATHATSSNNRRETRADTSSQ